MKVLLTGHDGYVGSVLMRRLCQRAADVVGLDTGYYVDRTFGAAFHAVVSRRRDLRDVTPEDCAGADVVIHLAALSNDPLGALDPRLTRAINTEATIRLAQAAARASVPCILYASSCSVYGIAEDWVDETSPTTPLTTYAVSKLESEAALIRLYRAGEGPRPICLRAATAYGASQKLRLDLVLNDFVATALTQGEIIVHSDGTPWRPVIHVEDLADAYLNLLRASRGGSDPLIVNVGFTAQNLTVRDLAALVGEALHVPVTYEGRTSDSRSYRVRCDQYEALTGARPSYTVPQGIRHLAAQCRALGLTKATVAAGRYHRLATLAEHLTLGRLDTDLRWMR